MKNLVAICLCVAGLQAASLFTTKYLTPAPESSKVLAKVDGKDITAADVAPYLWDWRGQEALEDLLQYRMIKLQADKLQLTLPEAEVEAELKAQMDRVKTSLQPGEELDDYIRMQGFPKSRLYLRLSAELLLDKIVMRSFEPDRYVEVSTILIRPRSESANDLSEALRLAQEAYDSLKKGSKWEDVLKKYTNEPAALQSNGRLGWRMLGVFPQPVREDMLQVNVGQCTRPAQTQNGIQIFRLEKRGKDAKGEDLEALKGQFRGEARPNILEQIRKDAKIERVYWTTKSPNNPANLLKSL